MEIFFSLGKTWELHIVFWQIIVTVTILNSGDFIAFGILQIAYNKSSNSQCNLGKIHLHKNAVKRIFCKSEP